MPPETKNPRLFLLVAATELEMRLVRDQLPAIPGLQFLVTGPGPLETAVQLTSYLSRGQDCAGIINFGVAGGFLASGVEMLDTCLASREVLGDFGICVGDQILDFNQPEMSNRTELDLCNALFYLAAEQLAALSHHFIKGNFVTVNCASGTTSRGNFLRDRYQAICENMEGAAVARVAAHFAIPCLELRCVSNMVQDRQKKQQWRLHEAAEKCGQTVCRLLPALLASESPVVESR